MKIRISLFRLLMVAVGLGWLLPSGFAATNIVKMGDYWYSPTNITISAGDSITWSNIVLTGHDSTHQTNLWASPVLNRNGTWTYTFTNAGFYPYYCQLHVVAHPEQTGSVSVASAPNNPPTVAITNPPSGTIFTGPASVTIQASASDSDGGVTNVQFLVGSTVLANVATEPYAATTNGLPAGDYTLSAIVSDNNGAKATNSVSISVNITTPPPSPVTILRPTVSSNTFSFSFATQVGYTYNAQLTPSLNPISWSTFTNFPGNGSVVRITDSIQTNSHRYYRVGAQAP